MTRVATFSNYQSALLDLMSAQSRAQQAQERIDSGRVADPGPGASRNRQQTRTLLDALEAGGFDAAFGGARRGGARRVCGPKRASFL